QACVFADASASTDYVWGCAVSQNSGSAWTKGFRLRQDGQFNIPTAVIEAHLVGGTVPSLASCGTGATVVGGLSDFQITVGTTPGTCVATFATAFTNAPICAASLSTGTAIGGTSTTGAFTVVGTIAST